MLIVCDFDAVDNFNKKATKNRLLVSLISYMIML